MDEFFIGLSSLPVRLALLGVGVVLVCAIARSWRPAIATGLAVGVTHLLTLALKELVDRPRPTGTEPLVPMPDSASFPSGHASTAFAAAAALAVFGRSPWLRAALFATASAIALSRVWLGVHYPSDVVAGAIIGALVGWAIARSVARAGRGGDAAAGAGQEPGRRRRPVPTPLERR